MVRLTADAHAHGRALALPDHVSIPAMPSRGRPRKDMALARFREAGGAVLWIGVVGTLGRIRIEEAGKTRMATAQSAREDLLLTK